MAIHISPARRGIAGQIAFDVTADDGSACTFIGSEYGTPGPIVIAMRGWSQVFVDEPQRHGDKFDRKWVERFFSDER